MKKVIIALFFISILAQLQGCAELSDERSITQQMEDNSLSSMALKKVNELNINTKEIQISFFSNSGYLLLVGQVKSQQIKNAIETKLETLTQAKEIYNQLRISKPIGFAQQTQDGWITAKIKSQFASDEAINPFQIKVVTENSEVFLIGTVTKKMANTATYIARHVNGVKQVNRVFQLIDE